MNNFNPTRIKMCGFTRENDVDFAVSLGVDAIGFVLYPKSARFVSLSRAEELSLRLPPFVRPVLLFVNARLSEIQAAKDAIPNAIFQFHGDETPEFCNEATQNGKHPFWRVARIPLQTSSDDLPFDLIAYANDYPNAKALLLDAHVSNYGGSGLSFDWSKLPSKINAHLILSGGLTSENVQKGIQTVRERGLSLAVDVSSGIEISKGVKSFEKMQKFVESVRALDSLL